MTYYGYGLDHQKEIGRWLAVQLKKRNMTQEEFAFRMGVDERTVRRWINEGVGRINVLEDIASFFQMEVGISISEEKDIPSHCFILIIYKCGKRRSAGQKVSWRISAFLLCL